MLAPVAAEGDESESDQDQRGGGRLWGGQEQGGRLLQVGLGVVEVAEPRVRLAELAEGVRDAPAQDVPDDGERLLV